MKVIISGGISNFSDYLTDKLTRESHTVYHITDQIQEKHSYRDGKVIYYDIKSEEKYTQYVISSIEPDAIIFLGAHNSTAKDHYLSALTNLLAISVSLGVKRFVYLSDYSVYGKQLHVNEDHVNEAAPEDMSGIVIAEGERLCTQVGLVQGLDTVVLRISSVYGPILHDSSNHDTVTEQCTQAIGEHGITITEDYYQVYTYVTDAVDAVYKVVTAKQHERTVYNVSGGEPLRHSQVADIIAQAAAAEGNPLTVTKPPAEEGQPVSVAAVDSSDFCQEYHFQEFYTAAEGIKNVYHLLARNKKLKNSIKPPEEKKSYRDTIGALFKKFLPTLETVLLFLAVSGITVLTRQVPYLQNVDYFLLFVVIIAVSFGKQPASLAVLAAALFYIYDKILTNYSIVDVLINFDFILRLLTLFAIGMIVGHTRDRLKEYNKEKDEFIKYQEKEYEELSQIYQTTLQIKKVLENRLLSYGDSLAKIQAVVAELESMMPQKIMNNAVDVITNIMGSSGVSIFYYDDKSDYCRLVASSSHEISARSGKSMKLKSMEDVRYVLDRREVYVNRTLTGDRPLLASGIYQEDRLIIIIMIWEMEFESLTPYHTNLLAVLSKMISAAAQRAYTYEEAAAGTKFIPDTQIYKAEAMEEFLAMLQESQQVHHTPFSAIEINEPLQRHKEIADILSTQLRVYDYPGYYNGRFIILLSNTTAEESKFFIKRIGERGIHAGIIENNKINRMDTQEEKAYD